jgi:hypothetical protein
MEIVIVESSGTWLHFFEGNRLVAYVPLRNVHHTIWQLSNSLVGVIRTVSHGNSVSEHHLEFLHRACGSLWLSYDIPPGCDAHLELREYGTDSVIGWHADRTPYRVVHTMVATSRELADMLYQMLRTLSRSRIGDIMDTDLLLFSTVADALRIYKTEANKIEGLGRRSLCLQQDAPCMT